jgi:hypothetical protein
MYRADRESAERFATRLYRSALATAAIAVLVAITVMGMGASDWIGRPFPGFFVFANRVIPSIGLPDWPGSRDGTLYQRTVVAVEGHPVADGAEVYRLVERLPVAGPLTYDLRSATTTETVHIRSAVFSRADYWAIFGAYLATGFVYAMLGLLGAWLFPRAHLGRALFFLGSAGGIYGLSAVGIYGPAFPVPIHQIHALAEAFLPTTLIYLALVFPRERGALLRPILTIACALSVALALPYLLVLGQPGAYSSMHAACETYMGVAGLALTGSLIVQSARVAADSDILLRTATTGAMLGLGVPAVVVLISGVTGGSLPVNVLTVTAFFFPLSLGYGLVRDRLSRRHALRAAAASSPL